MILADFRSHFPEFASDTVYPNGILTFWSGIAEKQLIESRWADLYTHGVELATAHYLTLAKQTASNQGNTKGVVASKSVGDISMSFDTTAIFEKDGGHWNKTSYGTMFIRLARMVGMGGAQL